jgi:ribosome modulation factor
MNEKWEEGYKARLDGQEPEHNPYADKGEFSEEFCDWQNGWECADSDIDD